MPTSAALCARQRQPQLCCPAAAKWLALLQQLHPSCATLRHVWRPCPAPAPRLLTFFMRVATSLLRALLYMRACATAVRAAASSEEAGPSGRRGGAGGRRSRAATVPACKHVHFAGRRLFSPSRPCAAASASSAWPPPRRPLLPRCAAAALRARREGQGLHVRCSGDGPHRVLLPARSPRPTTAARPAHLPQAAGRAWRSRCSAGRAAAAAC